MAKAEITRLNILQQAFELIYRNGYQATSVDDILARTTVTKGAFYYHFKNKDEMGLAMINEVMYPGMVQVLINPLINSHNSVDDIYIMMNNLLLKSPFFQVEFGCPAVNLIDEMAPLNSSFKQALHNLMKEWQAAIEQSIMSAKRTELVQMSVDERQVAQFIIVGYSGVRNMGKMLGKVCYRSYLKELRNYLSHL